jgi:hypothetical protein
MGSRIAPLRDEKTVAVGSSSGSEFDAVGVAMVLRFELSSNTIVV